MAQTQRHKEVHTLAGLSLDLALKNVETIAKLVPAGPTTDRTHKILRELSLLVLRVGEAIVDQVAASK